MPPTTPHCFRGAVVEDLQLGPALVLPTSTTVATALRLAYERDFSILPVCDNDRKLKGWIQVDLLRKSLVKGSVSEEMELGVLNLGAPTTGENVQSGWTRFEKGRKYKVITPDTSCEEVEAFFQEEGKKRGREVSFALVTDEDRKFVLGVVTKDDLQKFWSRRNPAASAAESVPTSLTA